MAASTSGATVVEIIYCTNEDNQRALPVDCQQELADRIQAFRVAQAADPTFILPFKERDPQGRDVYGAILVI